MTFRLVAQCLNRPRHCVPPFTFSGISKHNCSVTNTSVLAMKTGMPQNSFIHQSGPVGLYLVLGSEESCRDFEDLQMWDLRFSQQCSVGGKSRSLGCDCCIARQLVPDAARVISWRRILHCSWWHRFTAQHTQILLLQNIPEQLEGRNASSPMYW